MERGRNPRAPGSLRRYPPRATYLPHVPSTARAEQDAEPSSGRWPGQHYGELSAEDELKIAFGRAIGFTVAAFVLLVGGGIFTIVLAALFFGFLFGH